MEKYNIFLFILFQMPLFDLQGTESFRELCQQIHNITDEEFESFNAFEAIDVEPDRKFKCYAHCLLSHLKYLNLFSGKFDIDDFKQQDGIEDEDVAVIAKCKKLYDNISDPCEYGFKIMQCILMFEPTK
ncbi:odorant-binding protein 57c isoform 1-T1 [Glossina fuscipes fuscipes]